MTAAERIAREHELGRAYAAAQTLAERLELAGLDELAKRARGIRGAVWRALDKLAITGGRPPVIESEARALAGDR